MADLDVEHSTGECVYPYVAITEEGPQWLQDAPHKKFLLPILAICLECSNPSHSMKLLTLISKSVRTVKMEIDLNIALHS